MKISIALLALLAWAFLSIPLNVGALTSNTWVNNLSSKGLTASITYDFSGDPQFINREVPAGQAVGRRWYHLSYWSAGGSMVYHVEFPNCDSTIPASACVLISAGATGCADHDEYDGVLCVSNPNGDTVPIKIEIWLDTSSQHQNMSVACDQSILALDRAGSNSVDIYTSVYGDINTPDGTWVLILDP